MIGPMTDVAVRPGSESSQSASPQPGGHQPSPNREVWRATTAIFSLLALLLAFTSLIVATRAWSRSNDARSAVNKLAAGGLIGHKMNVKLQEFSMTTTPSVVKAGSVEFTVTNKGSVTHEMVLVRATNPAALPIVKTATADREVGDVDEEAIPAADKMGETGDVDPGHTVIKKFTLTPGTYVMFCNIDTKATGGILNHFQHGMSAAIVVS